MYDFGTTPNHSNSILVPHRAALDAMPSYTIAFKVRPRVAIWTASRGLITHHFPSQQFGWAVRTTHGVGPTNRIRMVHATSPVVGTGAVDCTTDIAAGATSSVVITYDGTTVAYSINGAPAGSAAIGFSIGSISRPVEIGNEDNTSARGAEVALGHVMIWPNKVLSAIAIAQYHAGITVPDVAFQELWFRGIEVPGIDEIRLVIGTQVGIVGLFSDDVDDDFGIQTTNPPFRQLATETLITKASDQPAYRLKVPLHFLKIPLMGLFNISHDSLLRSASHLAELEKHQLMDAWRRGLVRLIGITTHRRDRALTIEFEDTEKSLALYFSTDKSVGGTADHYPALARMDLGGTFAEERTSIGYLEQENDRVTPDSDGVYIAAVSPNVQKMSHKGALSEIGVANKILNPAFSAGLTSWTSATAGGGTVTSVTNRHVLPPNVSGNSIQVVGAAAVENSIRQVRSMLAADAFARLSFLHSDRQNAPPGWQVQRSSDSQYWNDATGAFGAAATVNAPPTAWDALNSVEIVKRAFSKPIPIASNQDWTIRLGAYAATTHNFYAANLTTGKLRYSLLVDTVATVNDEFTDTLDVAVAEAVRQLVYAGRGTISLEMLAEQDGGDLIDGQQLCLLLAQFGSSGKDFYSLLYQKLGGQNVRFSFERWRDVAGTSTLDARSVKDLVIVRGQTYRVCARFVSEGVGGISELALPSRTMRIAIDGVGGVDVVASALFSTTERLTKLWFGCAPVATGFLPSMNHLSVVHSQQRVITNEELMSV